MCNGLFAARSEARSNFSAHSCILSSFRRIQWDTTVAFALEDVNASSNTLRAWRVHQIESSRHERIWPALIWGIAEASCLTHADEERVSVVAFIICHWPNLNETHWHVDVGGPTGTCSGQYWCKMAKDKDSRSQKHRYTYRLLMTGVGTNMPLLAPFSHHLLIAASVQLILSMVRFTL